MGLDLTIKSCCSNPRFRRISNDSIEVYFGKDGWPIVNYIQDELGHIFEDGLDIVHLNYYEFCRLISHLEEIEFYDYKEKSQFIGSVRWFELGIIIGCCKDCGVDVFASW